MGGYYVPFVLCLLDIISGHAIGLNYYFIAIIKLIGEVIRTTLALVGLLMALISGYHLLMVFLKVLLYKLRQIMSNTTLQKGLFVI